MHSEEDRRLLGRGNDGGDGPGSPFPLTEDPFPLTEDPVAVNARLHADGSARAIERSFGVKEMPLTEAPSVPADTTPVEDRILDGETQQQYETGAVRNNVGKPRLDLVPPSMLWAFARATEYGNSKYPERNWEKGMPMMSVYASALRHLMAWVEGEYLDQTAADAGYEVSHLEFALWNLAVLVEHERRMGQGTLPESLDDRPRY